MATFSQFWVRRKLNPKISFKFFPYDKISLREEISCEVEAPQAAMLASGHNTNSPFSVDTRHGNLKSGHILASRGHVLRRNQMVLDFLYFLVLDSKTFNRILL